MEKVEKGIKRKRQAWSDEEVKYFISLIQERHTMCLLDGKKFRTSEIFKQLATIMTSKGYNKDAKQLCDKWKNLKSNYYFAKKLNNTSGMDGTTAPFYKELDEILGSRPACNVQDGFDSTPDSIEQNMTETNTQSSFVGDSPSGGDSANRGIDPAMYDNIPDSNGAVPGGSGLHNGSHISNNNGTLDTPIRKRNKKATKKSYAQALGDFTEETKSLQKVDHQFQINLLDKFLQAQEKLMEKCTKQFLLGLQQICGQPPTSNQVWFATPPSYTLQQTVTDTVPEEENQIWVTTPSPQRIYLDEDDEDSDD